MAWELSDDLQKHEKDDKEYSETEDVKNIEGMDGPERQRTVDDDENIR